MPNAIDQSQSILRYLSAKEKESVGQELMTTAKVLRGPRSHLHRPHHTYTQTPPSQRTLGDHNAQYVDFTLIVGKRRLVRTIISTTFCTRSADIYYHKLQRLCAKQLWQYACVLAELCDGPRLRRLHLSKQLVQMPT